MPDITLDREFDIAPDDLWSLVTTPEGLVAWWGPADCVVPDHALDFSRTGPWYSVMVSDAGRRFKVSGQVTHVRPKISVGLTWAWHDPEDRRGRESHVTLTVAPAGAGRARLTVDHRELADAEQADLHRKGWVSTLDKLQARISIATDGE